LQLQNCVVIKLISVRYDFSFSPFYHLTSFSSFSFFWLFYERSVNCSVRLVLYWCIDIRPCHLCVFHNLNHVVFILSRSILLIHFIKSNQIDVWYGLVFILMLCKPFVLQLSGNRSDVLYSWGEKIGVSILLFHKRLLW